MSGKSDRAKGNRLQQLIAKWYQAGGYQVHVTVSTGFRTKHGWMSRSNDLFGCWDIEAIHPVHKPIHAQVTTATNAANHKQKISEKQPFVARGFIELLFLWYGGRVDPEKPDLLRQCFKVFRRYQTGVFAVRDGDDEHNAWAEGRILKLSEIEEAVANAKKV